MANLGDTQVVTGEVRFSYVNLLLKTIPTRKTLKTFLNLEITLTLEMLLKMQ